MPVWGYETQIDLPGTRIGRHAQLRQPGGADQSARTPIGLRFLGAARASAKDGDKSVADPVLKVINVGQAAQIYAIRGAEVPKQVLDRAFDNEAPSHGISVMEKDDGDRKGKIHEPFADAGKQGPLLHPVGSKPDLIADVDLREESS